MEVVKVDSTVQEKAVHFPTDAALLYTAPGPVDIERNIEGNPELSAAFAESLRKARIIKE